MCYHMFYITFLYIPFGVINIININIYLIWIVHLRFCFAILFCCTTNKFNTVFVCSNVICNVIFIILVRFLYIFVYPLYIFILNIYSFRFASNYLTNVLEIIIVSLRYCQNFEISHIMHLICL